jgi:ectoine hydroxylase-related dioxygenase (phytanoyl-CoA dioxygenase family)
VENGQSAAPKTMSDRAHTVIEPSPKRSVQGCLPSPTDDWAEALADVARFGYGIVSGALGGEQVAQLRQRVTEQARGEEAVRRAFHDGGANQRIWMLINKGKAFRDLALHPLATAAMTVLLGKDFLLSSLTANIARPGGEAMYLHTDQGYIDFWTPKPMVANVAWMLDDFTDENGGTRLAPGSHLDEERRPLSRHDTVAAEGPAGSALIFDGRLVHGTGASRASTGERRAVLAYYCRPYVRQQENFFLGLEPALAAGEREALLRRLGYWIWAGLGRTDSPAERGVLKPLTEPTGRLTEKGRAARAADRGLFDYDPASALG